MVITGKYRRFHPLVLVPFRNLLHLKAFLYFDNQSPSTEYPRRSNTSIEKRALLLGGFKLEN